MTTEVNFASLGLAEPLLRAISDAGYTTPTPIQIKAIPLVLAGGDLLAAAQTGTGKTAGFTLPVLHRLLTTDSAPTQPRRPRCLILTPTRELAAQVEESVQTYGKHVSIKSMVMFGGVSINPQIDALRKKVDILVATPGRLLDHVGQKTLDLSGIEILVLDEADRMLDMGFIRDIKKILALLPKQRQNLLFSATFSDDIRALADGLLNKPGCVEVARRNTTTELVTQAAYHIPQKQKRQLLAHLVKKNNWTQVLVFMRTKHGANRLAEYLAKNDIPAAAIHGNKSQGARTRALADFKAGAMPVLVATDIAARGLDIDQLPHVVNFELPNVPEDYVHRIGRTGRAGSTGEAISFVDTEEMKFLRDIEKLINRKIERITADDFVPTVEAPDAPRPPQQPRRARNSSEPARQAKPRQPGTSPNAKPSGPRRSGEGQSQQRRAQPQATGGGNGNGQAQRASTSQGNRSRDPNRAPAPRPDVDGNRAEPRRSDAQPRSNTAAAPRPQGNRPPQRAALFSAKPVDGNR